MRTSRILFVIFVLVVFMTACKNTPEDTSQNQSQSNDTLSKPEGDTSTVERSESSSSKNKDYAALEANKNSDSKSSKETETKASLKDEYLKILNEMEEADRNGEVGSTLAELEDQEAKRYEKWDKELNDIYRLLEEQLSAEQMSKLREEQRKWIPYRDETAKEESLKYQGSSTEFLEYVATQASLTKERCYLLVARYME